MAQALIHHQKGYAVCILLMVGVAVTNIFLFLLYSFLC